MFILNCQEQTFSSFSTDMQVWNLTKESLSTPHNLYWHTGSCLTAPTPPPPHLFFFFCSLSGCLLFGSFLSKLFLLFLLLELLNPGVTCICIIWKQPWWTVKINRSFAHPPATNCYWTATTFSIQLPSPTNTHILSKSLYKQKTNKQNLLHIPPPLCHNKTTTTTTKNPLLQSVVLNFTHRQVVEFSPLPLSSASGVLLCSVFLSTVFLHGCRETCQKQLKNQTSQYCPILSNTNKPNTSHKRTQKFFILKVLPSQVWLVYKLLCSAEHVPLFCVQH